MFKTRLGILKVGWKAGRQSGRKVRMTVRTHSPNEKLYTENNKNRPK